MVVTFETPCPSAYNYQIHIGLLELSKPNGQVETQIQINMQVTAH